jgi:hypothetical protein
MEKVARPAMQRQITALTLAWLSGCASLRPAVPEIYYRVQIAAVADSICGDLAAAMVGQSDLARDSSHEVMLGGSRCHEILYAADGNEVWIQLRSNELTVAVRFYQRPGELSQPAANTQALANAATAIIREHYPDALIEPATERE